MGKACPFDQHIQFELHFHLMGLCHSARSRAARHLRTNVDLTISSPQGRTALSVSCSSKTNLTTVTTSFSSQFIKNSKKRWSINKSNTGDWIPMDSHGGLCPPSHGTACATKSSATPRGSCASENPMASKTNSMKLPVMGNDSSHLVASRRSKSARITMNIHTSKCYDRHCKGKWWQQFWVFFVSVFLVRLLCARSNFHTLVVSSCTLPCFPTSVPS